VGVLAILPSYLAITQILGDVERGVRFTLTHNEK